MMNSPLRERTGRRRAAAAVMLIPLLLCLLAGCRLPDSEVRLVSYKDREFPEPYGIRFTDCTYRTEPTGDYHIVARVAREPGDSNSGAITQYMHIHLFWKPRPGRTFVNRSTIDATLRYVIVTDAGTVEYSGTGFVYPKHPRRSDKLIAEIESARLKVASLVGEPTEMLGDSRLTGVLVATFDPSRTLDLLHEMNLHAAGQGATSGPPAEPKPTE